ncbi:DUF6966 domain-containing protein [Laribacter hongkongensis]|uniref:DUF6966 domain-containing protein n=1 Tax=Laribacter hongkongensis TaxID=168471 RepID=UPI00358DA779
MLDELVSVLESGGNAHWGEWIRQARTRLLNSDYSGIECILSAYGGMGSLNDVVLGQSCKDGVIEWKPESVELNERFAMLNRKAWELASSIKQSQ